MGYFTSQELAAAKNEVSQPRATAPKPKTKGRGGYLSSLISEAGGTGGALGGAALGTALLPGIGTVIGAGLGGFLGGTGGRIAENEVRDGRVGIGDALKEGAVSGVASAGPIKLAKSAAGAIRGAVTGSGAIEGASKAAGTSIFKKLTGNVGDKVGKRLTEAGSGLKADKNVGGVARLEDQAGFMSKYTGTPRQQRVKMEGDMKVLSSQVDDILDKTPIQLDGAQVGERLKNAATDLTDSRYLDLDLNNPSVKAIIDRYSEKFASAKDAKSVNDIVKTLNKTATRAQNKLVDEKGGVLTAQEQAALALKRAGDDLLSSVPEIVPLKKNMAQIFEVTPQVAKQGEKGLSSSLVGGLKVKAPVQAGSAVASKLGSALQGGAGEAIAPGAKGFASRILAGKALTSPLPDEAMQQQDGMPVDTTAGLPSDNIGGQAKALTADDILAEQQDTTGQDTDPYSAANVQATVKSIIAQGGTQKDVAEFLNNAKTVNDLTATKATKPLSAEASKTIANANSGLSSLATLSDTINKSGVPKATLLPGRGLFGGLVGNAAGTSQYDTAAKNISDVITRLRSGAAITDQEAAFYNSQLPQAFDSPETVQEKLGIFKDLFTSVANQTGSAGTDLQSSLIQ